MLDPRYAAAEEAPADLFVNPPGEGNRREDPDLHGMPMTSASGVSPAGSRAQPGPAGSVAGLRPAADGALETLLRQLSGNGTFGPQVALLTARTNGSATCFDAWLPTGTVKKRSAAILREGDQALHRWPGQHPRSRALVTAVQLLTRSPDRFSAAQLTPSANMDSQRNRRSIC